ncbi:OadG-related small transporter subunit [Proteiniphilum sp. X52]|uniref:OadG-related small transporter subunit n=1 Tax=Proteiniphilum sp. X52 TaxID=2382159 RepID=UPI001314D2E0|nr:OadG-related small transporter subunit [Proteiniphilum sp. X52]
MTPTTQTALFIAVVGVAGIFVFMSFFYLIILALDKYLPYQEEKPEGEFIEEISEESEE